MSATSSALQLDNENSYSSRTKGGSEKDRKNTTNWENGKRSSSNSKSEARSVSSKYDDKSEHFERLLRESQQHVCNRDAIIDMLQKQLKRIEELYKKTLDQQQDVREKYANVVLELSRLRVICDQLKTENSTLSRANEETTRRYRYEKEGLQDELDTWRQEYDQLVRAINNMEKNTVVMKDILYSDDSYHQQILNGAHVEELLEQYKQIQGALIVQNDKLDKFLEKFHLIGDGGCSIVRNLEGVRCIGNVQCRSLSSIAPDRPEQVPISAIRRPDTRRRSETPPPSVSNDYYNMERRPQKASIDGSMRCHEVSIWSKEGKRPSKKVDEIIQTDSHSSICCVNITPQLLESMHHANSVQSCCEEMLIVPEKFMQTNYLAEAPYLIADECLQACSCSTSEASYCLELISPPAPTAEAIQTGPSCESVSEVIPSPIFVTNLAASPGSNYDSIESIPEEDTPPSLRSCCTLDDAQNTIHRIETAIQTESICESIYSVPQEKQLPSSIHSFRDQDQTSCTSGSICSSSRTPPNSHIIIPPRPIIKEKSATSGSIRGSSGILSKEKQLIKTHIFHELKAAQTIPSSSKVSLETTAKLKSIPESPGNLSKEESSSNIRSIRELKPIYVETAQTESIPENKLPPSGPIQQSTQSLLRERQLARTRISHSSKSAPTSAVSFQTPNETQSNSKGMHSFSHQKSLSRSDSSPVSKFVLYEKMTTQPGSICKSICSIAEEKQSSETHAPATMAKAPQTNSTCRDSYTPSDKLASIVAVEKATQTASIVVPATNEEASQTESRCRDSCTLSAKTPSTVTVEEVTQTAATVADSYTAPKIISPPQTIEEASQTESTCRNSCTLTDKLPSIVTADGITQTTSIAAPAIKEEASQTESRCRDSCTLSANAPSVVTVEEATQTASIVAPATNEEASLTESRCRDSCTLSANAPSVVTVEEVTQTAATVADSYTAPEIISPPQSIDEVSQTESTCRESCTLTDKTPSVVIVEEATETVSIATSSTIEGASQIESTCNASCSLSDKVSSTMTVEEVTHTVSKVTDNYTVPEAMPPRLTVEKASQTVSVVGDCCIFPETISPVTAEKATQSLSVVLISTGTDTSAASIIPGLLLTAEKATQTTSLGQICVTAKGCIAIPCTTEESTQTAPIGQISTEVPTVEESTQTISIDQITAESGSSTSSILIAEESTQTASSTDVEDAIQTESGSCYIGAIPEVIPPPINIGQLVQSARPTPEQLDQSVLVLPEVKDEATQIEIFSVAASIQTDGKPSTCTGSQTFGISIETQTIADESTQTVNLECTDCCTETEVQLDFDLYPNRKLITCHKRNKSSQISRKSSAVSRDEQELRTCCYCDDISLTVKPEATDKAVCTDFLDSGDGGLLAENERLQQLILVKDLTIKRLQEENSLDCSKLKEEALEEKQKLQDENIALKQDLANIEYELERLKTKLVNVEQEISTSEDGKDHYISETNVLLNEYEASLQELNQKYASAITENQSLTEEVAILMEQVSFLNETIKQHKEQASICKLQLENMTEKVKELEHTIKELEEQDECISNPSENVDELNPALQELTEQCNILKEENETLLEYNKEVLLLKKKNSNLVREIDAKDVIIDELQAHIEELQKELDLVKEEMESNNDTAKEEMDKLIQVCNELEQKLETTKELLEKEVSLMDQEVSASLGPYSEHTDEVLQNKLDEKSKQLEEAKEELQNVKDNFEEEMLKLNAKNTLLELQLEKEQLNHQREIETIEEKLAQCHKEYVSTVVSCSDIGSSDSSTVSSELTNLLEECVEKNKRLHEELRTCKDQIKSLQESGKECGLLKAENMKLKVQISAMQKELAEMKDVEEKLKRLKHEKEELIVKVKYLEKQLAISRCRCERAKKPPPLLDTIKEETTQRPCTPVAPKPKAPCCPCSQKINHTRITLAAPCATKINTNSPADTDHIVTCKDSQIGGALGTLNLRLASINRMEGQIDQMIMSVRRQNQKMNECNLSRLHSDKDIKECLSNLRHKREQLMGSLNKFKQELTVFEHKTKARVCNCPKPRNPT